MNKSPPTQTIKIEATTLEQALVIASGKLGVSQAEIGYEVTQRSGGGFLGLFRKPKVEINAWRRGGRANGSTEHQQAGEGNQQRGGRRHGRRGGRDQRRGRNEPAMHAEGANTAEEKEKRQPPAPLSAETKQSVQQELTDFCRELCEKMVGETVEVSASFSEDDRLQIEIDNAAVAEMMQKNTKLVESFEHLLRKKPRHLKQELPFRVFVDARGSRKSREQELEQLAQDLSNQVFENKKPIVLNYRSAADRRIIHLALEKDERVYTKSIGSGPHRKLMILPAREGRKSNNMDRDSADAPMNV